MLLIASSKDHQLYQINYAYFEIRTIKGGKVIKRCRADVVLHEWANFKK